jgi:glycosyl transferase family 25
MDHHSPGPQKIDLQTLVISLLRSPQRREKARSELSKTSLNWSFLDAVDGAQLKSTPPEYQPSKVKRLLGFELTPNEIGCFLSHKQAWLACLKNNQTTLIFEDDFILLPHFEKSLQLLLTEFDDWRMIRIQALVDAPHEVVKTIGDLTIVRNHEDPLGATAYLIKPEAARILVEHAKDIYEPLDHFLEHEEKHGVEILALLPYPVDISNAQSTISDRPNDRKPIRGWGKKIRSLRRLLDRVFSRDPWFPK